MIEKEREFIEAEKSRQAAYQKELELLQNQEHKTKEDYERIVELFQLIDDEQAKIKQAKKLLKNVEKTKYVKRDAVRKIIAAWVITVPAAALLSAMIFFMIKGMLL